jgi:hypothetical protein
MIFDSWEMLKRMLWEALPVLIRGLWLGTLAATVVKVWLT